MSLVIALKHNGRIILGADKQMSGGNSKVHNATKVWFTEYNNVIMGGAGSARCLQVIQNVQGLLDNLGYGKEITEDFIALGVTRTIYETLKMHKAIGSVIEELDNRNNSEIAYIPNRFFIAYKDKCWIINQDLTIEEVEDYAAIGSGEELAIGSIETALFYKETNPFKIITTAIDIAAEHTLFIDHEIDFVETESFEEDTMQKIEAIAPGEAAAIKEEIAKEKKESEKTDKPKKQTLKSVAKSKKKKLVEKVSKEDSQKIAE